MQNILRFFVRYRIVLSLLLFQVLGLSLTYARSLAHESIFWANVLERQAQWRGWLHGWESYLALEDKNKQLIAEIARYKSVIPLDSSSAATYEEGGFAYTPGSLLFIEHRSTEPWGIIDVGTNAGLTPPFAVLGSTGIIGIAYECTPHYSRVRPLSHPSMRISASAERTGHFGTIQWNGSNPRTADFVDVAIEADLKPGDRIVTDARSSVFPAGWLVGTVESVTVDSLQFTLTASIRLAADLQRQQAVLAAVNLHQPERDSIAP
ncbi:MAG: rod shape-determining protein MreC [Schleiferiaceae bacterium]|jgi:rod shape-determining protein MreC|nr:rod shape-determining protein MreC [Schleiferiaceae bacterium]MDP4833688.1 rod shape-determining protein MreC [Schleiferiaceae bacterium]